MDELRSELNNKDAEIKLLLEEINRLREKGV